MKVIIFDMDGVLIDSEPAYLEMNKKLFKDLGIDLAKTDYHQFVGMSSKKMWTDIRDKFSLSNEVEELIEMERKSMYEILSSVSISSPMDGIIDLINILKNKNFILSVASSSARENIKLVLNKLNLTQYFEYVISGEDVNKGKPEPDIFLKVATKFNVPTSKCIVIEDSNNGVAAAKKAGMKCIGFKNINSGNQDLSKADLIIENFSQKSLDKIIEFVNSV